MLHTHTHIIYFLYMEASTVVGFSMSFTTGIYVSYSSPCSFLYSALPSPLQLNSSCSIIPLSSFSFP